MLQRSTIQLLRFKFSFFLLPVFLFAICHAQVLMIWRAVAVFFIIHFLVYPASNGYNSYMDRDTGSIGGVKHPEQPTSQLFTVSLLMDGISVMLSLLVSPPFALGILLYIAVSRAYSYRGIRLKKYPIIGYLTVAIFQGAAMFISISIACDAAFVWRDVLLPALISTMLVGGFYPLTQVYQHDEDLRDGVKTISYVLGYRGTFIFSGIVYSLAMALLFYYYLLQGEPWKFVLFIVMMAPVPWFFIQWAMAVWKNNAAADFRSTMKLNVIASVCTNIAFLSILISQFFE